MKLGQNFVKYFVRFLGVSRKNAFEIYWSLSQNMSKKGIIKMQLQTKKILNAPSEKDFEQPIMIEDLPSGWFLQLSAIQKWKWILIEPT